MAVLVRGTSAGCLNWALSGEALRSVLLTSTERRHSYMAVRLAEITELKLVVQEKKDRESSYAHHPDRALITNHFERLVAAEESHFATDGWSKVAAETVAVARGALNSPEVAARLRDAHPDIVVVFGCGIIKPPLLEVLPHGWTLNLHQGLSPYYRGSGTNFWPFVNRQPQYIGATIHLIDPGVDTGGIIAHTRPSMHPNDGLHDLGCKTVKATAYLLSDVIALANEGQDLDPLPQWPGGALYRRSDLTGEAIETVRNLERNQFMASFLRLQQEGLISPVRLVRLER